MNKLSRAAAAVTVGIGLCPRRPTAVQANPLAIRAQGHGQMKTRGFVFAAAMLTGAAVAVAPVAHADHDQMFISVLDGHNLSVPDMNSAIQSGHMACRELAAGKDEISVEIDVSGANPPGISRADASWVVAAAKKAFCPGS
jgi:Protein of unknown function (DUF732)